ncbi:surface lipoprotein assembly modifier [Marinobacter sp.]|uniref:surface lipoprotein assembly modifier n=1 Tax=Marinobacter sp. TaxID=50741 RepID=UPI002B267A5A|nr:surface lipoprotein assembly modifier [Marinobacter sp.]
MRLTLPFSKLPLAVAMVVTTPALWASEHAELNGHVGAGMEYDNNLTVDELDRSSDNSDQAWVFDAGLEAILKPSEALNLTLDYSVSGSRYQTYDEFDQDIHLASADLSYDFDPVTVGASYHYSHATLDSEAFLDFTRTSVYLGSLLGDSTYVMLSLQDKTKEFEDTDARDADIKGVSLDAFFFFNDARSHLLFGVDGDKEDAQADAYDNRLIRVRASWVHKFQMAGQDNRLRLKWHYEDREYDDVVIAPDEPLLNNPFTEDLQERTSEQRVDQAWIVEAGWRIGLNEVLSLEPKISYGHYTSNIESADYDKTVAGVTLRADF